MSAVEFTEDDEHVIAASADGVVSQWRVLRHASSNHTKVKMHQFHPEGGVYQTDRTRPVRVGTFANPASRA